MTLSEILGTPGAVPEIQTNEIRSVDAEFANINGIDISKIIHLPKIKISVDSNEISFRSPELLSVGDYQLNVISTGLYEIELVGGDLFPPEFYAQLTVRGLDSDGDIFRLSSTQLRVKTVVGDVASDASFSVEIDW